MILFSKLIESESLHCAGCQNKNMTTAITHVKLEKLTSINIKPIIKSKIKIKILFIKKCKISI